MSEELLNSEQPLEAENTEELQNIQDSSDINNTDINNIDTDAPNNDGALNNNVAEVSDENYEESFISTFENCLCESIKGNDYDHKGLYEAFIKALG